MLLKDKVVVITGSTRGIGKGIAVKCASEGAKVVACGTKQATVDAFLTDMKKNGYECSAMVCDVTQKAEVEALMKFASDTYGTIDALVANAGITDVCEFKDLDEDRWDRMLNINLKGEYLADRAVLPYFFKNGKGKIVNIGSDCSVEGWKYLASYSAAKFGVRGMTQALAKELGKYNITVNCICPGIIDTDMWVEGDSKTVAITGEEKGASWQANVDRIPLGRAGKPEDIGNGAVLLLSGYADYITGTTLMVGGGSAVN